MRHLVTICLALVLFFAMCVSVGSSEVDTVKKQIADLKGYAQQLEGVYVNAMNEFQGVLQESAPVYARAKKILDTKKKDFTCEEKVVIMTAAYYEQYLEKLVIALKFIDNELNNAYEKIKSLQAKLDSMKEA